jgi:hypothetical protein
MLSEANSMTANADLSSRHVDQGLSLFRPIPGIMSNLPTPNLLHTMQICMLDYFQKWIFHLIKAHKPIDKYNAI